MQSKKILLRNLEARLSNLKNPSTEELLLTAEEVSKILVDFDEEMLTEYSTWFVRTEELAEWLGLLFKRNEYHVEFPSVSKIKAYRSKLIPKYDKLSNREIVEFMEFFTPNQINLM